MSPAYKIDKILGEHGHEVVRLPPYSPEFNPIEKIWGLLKIGWQPTMSLSK
jgi:transposase